MCVRAHVPTNTLTITTIPKTTKQPNKSSALNSLTLKHCFGCSNFSSTNRTLDSEQWVPLRGVGEDGERERETSLPMYYLCIYALLK
jgi:hypothetical protein